jgi:hypothetical protein
MKCCIVASGTAHMPKEVLVAIITALATIIAGIGGAFVTGLWTRKRAGESDMSTSREAQSKKQHRFDVFVSAPLAAVPTDKALRDGQERVAKIVALLEGQLGFTVFWAGRSIRKKADFEAADLSAKADVAALLDSKYFLMIYPERTASSVLFEAGIALRACLTSIYFVRKRADLPFLMTQASQAFVNVRTYDGTVPDDLMALLMKHGKSFFDPRSNL